MSADITKLIAERDAARLRCTMLEGALGHAVPIGTPDPNPDDHRAKNVLCDSIGAELDRLMDELKKIALAAHSAVTFWDDELAVPAFNDPDAP